MTATASTTDRVTQALDRQVKEEVTVLSSLIYVQEEFGFLPPESIPLVADYTDASINDVFGVATFYTHFRFTPPGPHTVEVCWGPSCHVMGATAVIAAAQEALGLSDEGDTADRKATLRYNTCLGACAHAPVMAINHHLAGRITPDSARSRIASALASAPAH